MDGVSGAGAVVSVVSLAIQLAGTIQKIQTFFSSIRDAPNDVRHVQRTLSTISAILSEVQNEDANLGHDDGVEQALEDCRACLQRVEQMIAPSQRSIVAESKCTRMYGRFKMVNCEGSITKLRRELEQAKDTLLLALQISTRTALRSYIRDAPRQIRDMVRDETLSAVAPVHMHIDACQDASSQMMSLILYQTQQNVEYETNDQFTDDPGSERNHRSTVSPHVSISVPEQIGGRRFCTGRRYLNLDIILGRLSAVTEDFTNTVSVRGEQSTKGPDMMRTRIVFMPCKWSRWLGFTHVIDISIARELSFGWRNVLNVPRIIPDDSLIFDYCKMNDTVGILELFAEGQASVHDVNSTGMTALHFAAFHHQAEICSVLISCGADMSARDGLTHATPFQLACWTKLAPGFKACPYLRDYDDTHDTEPRQTRTLRALVNAGILHEELEGISGDLLLGMAVDDSKKMLMGTAALREREPSYCWLLKQLAADVIPISDSDCSRAFWQKRCCDNLYSTGDICHTVVSLSGPSSIKGALMHIFATLETTFALCSVIRAKGAALESGKSFHNINFMLSEVERRSFAAQQYDLFMNELLRRALGSFLTLRTIAGLLNIAHRDLREFAARQAPLLGDSWSPEKLLRLMNSEFQYAGRTERFSPVTCSGCGVSVVYSDASRPLWQQHVSRVQRGLDPTGPFEARELIEHTAWTRYLQAFKEEHVCISCHNDMLKEASGEIECHPGLLDIDL